MTSNTVLTRLTLGTFAVSEVAPSTLSDAVTEVSNWLWQAVHASICVNAGTPGTDLEPSVLGNSAWVHNIQSQLKTLGFDPIREAWIARAARRGEVITARTGEQAITGIFETVDSTGALVLTTSHGRQAVAAADIFF